MKTKLDFYLVEKLGYSCLPESNVHEHVLLAVNIMFILNLAGLRGTEGQFPKHTTIEQQFPFSMCN